jgi:hypothetical protein
MKLFDDFRINRQAGFGEYRILEIFPDLKKPSIFSDIFGDRSFVEEVFKNTGVRIIKQQTDMFVDNDDGTINIGIQHLKESDTEVLYLDIIHELVHVRQQREGLDLYDRSKAYVDRETEIEAYEYTIKEARKIGLSEKEILDYLSVEWITPEEYRRLADRLGVDFGSNIDS